MGEPDYSPDRGAPQTKPAPRLDGSCTGRSGARLAGAGSCTRRDRATVDVQDDLRPPWGCVLCPPHAHRCRVAGATGAEDRIRGLR